MTIIAGLIHDGSVWIGADSAGCSDWTMFVRGNRKLFRNGPFLIGCCGSSRLSDILQHSFTPPERDESRDVERFMCGDFVGCVRLALRAGGLERKEHEVATIPDNSSFLVGYAGRLFSIEADFQVSWLEDLIAAHGCGREPALGSLYSTRDLADPQVRLMLALETAERFSAGVRRPFHVEVLVP